MVEGKYMGKTANEWELEASYYKTRYNSFGNTADWDTYEEYMRYARNARNAGDDTTSSGSSGTTSGGGSSHDPNLITYTNGADSIVNTLAGVTITALGGNDTIISNGKNVGIIGGADNDRIYNGYKKNSGTVTLVSSTASYGTVDGGDGNDYIENCAYNTSIYGGAGSDTIENGSARFSTGTVMSGYGSSDTIDGGTGNDSILNSSDRSLINLGDGADTVWNGGDGKNVTIYGGEGNDSILNAGSNSTLFGDAGNDTIRNFASNVTINGGRGNDLISLSTDASNNVIEYQAGDGDDKIYGFKYNSTLRIGDGYGTYSTTKSYNYNSTDIIVTVGDSKITLYGAGSLSKVNILGSLSSDNGSDTNSGGGSSNPKIITGTGGTDLIHNGEYGSKGDSNLLINAGAGGDVIYNYYGSNVTIDAGDGDDYVGNYGENVSIDGGAGNDEVLNDWRGNFVTINGGAGDDTISIDTRNGGSTNAVLIHYKSGDGNDKIYGFKYNSTLQIGGGTGTYSASIDNSDLIITVGEGKIRLVGVADNLEYVNIFGEGIPLWSFNDSTATYGTSLETLITVKGVKSLDGLTLKNKVVTISAAALNKSKVTISDGYTLKLGKDVTKSTTSKAWSLKKSTASYKQTTTAGYTLADNAINYSKKSVETLATVKGAKSLDGLSVSGKKITLKNSALKSKVTIGGGYEFDFAKDYTQSTIIGSSGNDSITTRGKKISVNGDAGNDTIKIFGSATTVAGGKGNDSLWGSSYADSFIYSSGDGKDVIFGFDDKDTLTLDGLDFTASYSKKNQAVTFKVDNGSITLKDFTATTFNVNGSAYKIKGTNLVRK